MYIATFLSFLVLTSSLNCPISDSSRSTAFSGVFSAQPQPNIAYQDMSYTHNFGTSLYKVPQVCLSICGYQDQNTGIIQIQVDHDGITQTSFVLRVRSAQKSKWTKLGLNYLVSTKVEIQMGTITTNQPQYDFNGYITMSYIPTVQITNTIKVRPFIVALDIEAQNNGVLAISHDKTDINPGKINFLFSSKSCKIYSLSLSVVVFDTAIPGILFVDGSLEQNSLSTSTQVKVAPTYIQQLRIYFVGLSSLNAKDNSGLSISVSFSNSFSLMIDSTQISSVKVSYLVLSFVECGSCTGYPYPYSGTCYKQCPQGTRLQSGVCVPINCQNGYQVDANNQCVPKCGLNQFFSGKHCSCIEGYNMIGGECNRCPVGTIYNYVEMRCQLICGGSAQYNPTDGRCYCSNGYVLINGQCSTCPPGTTYDYQGQRCNSQCGPNQEYTQYGCQCIRGYNQVQGRCQICASNSYYDASARLCICPSGLQWDTSKTNCISFTRCGPGEVVAYGKCVCPSGSYRVNGRCQSCPPYSTYSSSLGYCDCNGGYQMVNGQCVISCRDNEVMVNGNCECPYGYNRNNYGQCVPVVINCGPYQTVVNFRCECQAGTVRQPNGQCYPITCPPGQKYDISQGRCKSICGGNNIWHDGSQTCIPTCQGGYTYDFTYKQCIPQCPANQRWNGQSCVCYQNCEPQCAYGSYYNPQTRRCEARCPNNQVWNGQLCTCTGGYIIQGDRCVPPCQPNADYVGNRCTCREGYYQSNGACIVINCQYGQKWDQYQKRCVSICSDGKTWDGNYCRCPPGSNDVNGQCVISCQRMNEEYVNGACQCRQGYYRIGGICLQCPANTQWNPIIGQCSPIQVPCNNGKVWNGSQCVCPPGTQSNQWGVCSQSCGPYEVPHPSGQCICREGYVKNNYGVCAPQCPDGYSLVNGNCVPGSGCGQGEEWAGSYCVCRANHQRVAPNVCMQACPRNSQINKNNRNCECIPGYNRDYSGQCVPTTNCPPPHQYANGVCNCAPGYDRTQAGVCVERCQPGYVRNSLGYCVPGCNNDQILVNGKCECRVGLYLNNGVCSSCPQFSTNINGACYCIVNNYPVSPGSSCPTPNNNNNNNNCKDKHGTNWDHSSQSCRCKPPQVWIYGGCKQPQSCGQNEVWNGQDCICVYGYRKVNGYCQPVNQQYYCPDNSNFNGVNCQCNDGFYPLNNERCERCPSNYYWTGQSCGPSRQCQPGFIWDNSKNCCVYQYTNCKANEYWDGANCRCSQGFFYINGVCQECPYGTVFDGKTCSSGQAGSQCNDPYSYFNGHTCVCVPGYWMLAGGCVTCPPYYEWNGICCSQRTGLTMSLANEPKHSTSVAVKFK